jgi:Zn-finger nucleic acid-binding protein
MKCPIDTDVDLVMTDRQGIEIDYCPKCRGVWLDRGELDKLIERTTNAVPPQAAAPRQERTFLPEQYHRPSPDHGYREHRRYHDDDDDDYNRGRRDRRRKPFLGEIFDF